MDMIEGFATRVRSSVELGDADDPLDDLEPRPRSPKYVVRFELTAREVAVTSRSPVPIAEGDRVLVAGSDRAGVLDALAYRNESTLAEGDRGWWPMLAASIILAGIGAGMFAVTIAAPHPERIPRILAGLLAAAGIHIGHRALRVLTARNRLRRRARQG